jgi:hypothetical protein
MRYKYAKHELERAAFSNDDKKLILQYLSKLESRGVGPGRTAKIRTSLNGLMNLIPDLKKETIFWLNARVRQSN